MSARGFTVVELLVAAALVLVMTAALGGLSRGMHRAFNGSITTVDLTGRARAALAAVAADVHDAGSGVAIGQSLQGLADLTAVVMPQRSLDDTAMVAPFTAVKVVRATGNQGVLLDRVSAGDMMLRLDPVAPSTRQDGTAGLRRGDLALVFDSTRVESIEIASVDAAAWTVTLSTPFRNRFEPGALIAAIERTTYGLRRDAAGNSRLVRRTTVGAEQPVVDHVAAFEVALWGIAEPPRPAAIPTWFPTYGPAPPPLGVDDDRDLWPPGENCTLVVDGAGQRQPRLVQSASVGTLVELTPATLSDGPWCPDPADAHSFDADLLRLARVDLRLRVEPQPDGFESRATPVSLFMSAALRQR